jgi:hypothetical protein
MLFYIIHLVRFFPQLTVYSGGKKSTLTFVGVVYLCEASSDPLWEEQALREELSGNPAFLNCFAFVPAHITGISQQSLGESRFHVLVHKMYTQYGKKIFTTAKSTGYFSQKQVNYTYYFAVPYS